MTSSERRRGEQRGLSPAATPSPSCGLLLPEEGTADGAISQYPQEPLQLLIAMSLISVES